MCKGPRLYRAYAHVRNTLGTRYCQDSIEADLQEGHMYPPPHMTYIHLHMYPPPHMTYIHLHMYPPPHMTYIHLHMYPPPHMTYIHLQEGS